MPPKVFLLILALIGSQCVLLVADTETAISLEEKQQIDTEIESMLYGPTRKTEECLNASIKGKPAIITGNYTSNEKPLWTVVIFKEETFGNETLTIQHCSGSLIHPQVVLTAAHCLYGKSLASFKVRAGECIQRSDLYHQQSEVESFVFHEAYNTTNPKWDVGLIFLKDPFKITDNVKTVCLPPMGVKLHTNYVQCIASGWKRKSLILPGYVNFKKFPLAVIPNVQCEKVLRLTSLGENFNLHKSFMCAAGEVDRDVMHINGGSPLVCSLCGAPGVMIQVGVVSWGFKMSPLPDVFTSIRNSRQWILEELQRKGLKLPGCDIQWN